MKKIVFLLIAISLQAFAAEERLVTITGELKPEFSFQVNESEMKRILEDLRTLGDLPKVTINVNSLMEPGDEKAIRQVAENIANKFVRASKILVDMKSMVYRLDALSQVYDGVSEKDHLKAAFHQKFQARYTELLGVFALIENAFANALVACRSEYCVQKVVLAQRTMIEYAELLNDKSSFGPKKVKYLSPLFAAAVEEGYTSLQNRDQDYEKMVASVMGGFVATSRGAIDFKNLLEKTVASKKTLKRLGFEVPELDSRVFVSEEKWLKEMGRRKLRSIILGESLEVPAKVQFARVHVLTCTSETSRYGDGFNSFHALVYGRTIRGINRCKSVRTDDTFSFELQSFGPGAMYTDAYFAVVILSPVSINPYGTWIGPSLAGSIMIGGEIGVLIGKAGSVMGFASANFGMGGRVGISSFTIRPEEKKDRY